LMAVVFHRGSWQLYSELEANERVRIYCAARSSTGKQE